MAPRRATSTSREWTACRTIVASCLFLATVIPASAMYSSGGPVINLDPSSFKKQLSGDGLWLVEFYAPWCGHCKALKPEWEKAAEALKGVVHVAAVDADEHKSLGGQYGVQGFPTIKLFTVQGGKIKASDYNGGRTAKDIAKFAIGEAQKMVNARLGVKGGSSGGSGGGRGGGGGGSDPFYAGTDVVSLDGGNFDELVTDSEELWMVEFYAPWCGHCKALKPDWIDAAGQLKDKVKLGAVNCDENENQEICGRFGVRGFPTIKYFGPNKSSPMDYDSARDTGAIVTFALNKWEKFAPPAEVLELVDQEVFVNECTGHEGDSSLDLDPVGAKTLCIIAFLPNILDTGAVGRNAYIDSLKAAAEQFKGRPFSFLWVEGGAHSALESNVDVGGYGYPAVVALSPKKGVFVTMKTALETGHLKTWIESLRKGGEKTARINGELVELSAVEAWDGQDGVVYDEDEFDLSDLMDEE
mmetsp:Transcript_11681/g.21053  ORF Transcript_11681/g.21053 Transcript_11681/m.21053 type:complete len:470 (-) Transcript_11681:187-1596(-)